MTANLLPNPSAASTRQSLGYPTDSYRLRHRLFAGVALLPSLSA